MRRSLLLATLLLAGCAQLPPSPEDIQAKKFEARPDMAVIYVVRPPVDSGEPGTLLLDNGAQVATMGGTYHRLEAPPGVRLIDGFSPPSPRLTLKAEAGKIYFLRYSVFGRGRNGPTSAALQQISEQEGRRLVGQAQLFP